MCKWLDYQKIKDQKIISINRVDKNISRKESDKNPASVEIFSDSPQKHHIDSDILFHNFMDDC